MNDIQFTLTDLNLAEVNAILVAIQELPAKICNPLDAKIRTQAQAQADAANKAAEAAQPQPAETLQ